MRGPENGQIIPNNRWDLFLPSGPSHAKLIGKRIGLAATRLRPVTFRSITASNRADPGGTLLFMKKVAINGFGRVGRA